MTSKEALEVLNKMACEGNDNATQRYADRIKEIILKDLEKLGKIKALVEKYNNDELHFTRGFDFVNIVKEVLEND